MLSEADQCCLLLPGSLIIKVCQSAGTQSLLIVAEVRELHKPMLLRDAHQDWLSSCSEAGISYGHVTMTHGKRLRYSNSAIFVDTEVPSRFHRTILWWLHDGISKISCSRLIFLRQSGNFLFPSNCFREAKNARYHRWSYEENTKMTRVDNMPSRWAKWTNEFNTKMNLRKTFGQFFSMPRFCKRSRRCAGAWEKPLAILWSLTMPSWMARCFHDHSRIWFRVSIWRQFWDSMTSALDILQSNVGRKILRQSL